ncbi:SGNH/GDSL hydrolase family protein [Shinella daejeonensis]|uniref:SGNH/GDSL hydrolase family protein n=1 Tax=Shinella daejeonensis TaxID=659017 RepID=UPI0020C79084|nr:DUF459 domain-containing protein [Shinella daejeonensis]
MTIRIIRAILAVAMAAGVFLPASAVSAQEQPRRKTILELFFGTPDRAVVAPNPTYREKPRQPVKRQPKRVETAAPPEPQKPEAVEKLPDAKKILVVGDFIGASLGEGLVAAFEMTPGIVIERRANGSSGVVRDDFYDWPAALPAIIQETDPAVIVVSLGANDRQQMTISGGRERFRSEAWTKEYEARVARIAELARNGGRPLLWVGMPAFQSSAMTADMTTFNTIYRAATEKAGGEFIDIWDGFVDEDGKFITSGSDINGQQVRLRGSDGINLTGAGKRKLAFYVEKEIRRLLGDAALSGAERQEDLKDLPVAAPADDADITQTPPIALSDPALDGGGALLGGAIVARGSGKSLRERLVEEGETADAPLGRVDDFRLPASATP